ncbi:YjbQ family protein [Candidatus Woesearchaeota archaeon]|nr:YjbQ family protein [Candidatus Woesearchaeota archaeon]
MKSFTEKLVVHTKKEHEFVNITSKVQEAIDRSGIKEGLCLVNSMHITSSVFINDEESGLKEDFMEWLEDLAPYKPYQYPKGYRHHQTGEVNGDAHLKRTIMGREVVVAVTDGKLDFGPWEEIFYGEFDGRRDKRIMIKIIGE